MPPVPPAPAGLAAERLCAGFDSALITSDLPGAPPRTEVSGAAAVLYIEEQAVGATTAAERATNLIMMKKDPEAPPRLWR